MWEIYQLQKWYHFRFGSREIFSILLLINVITIMNQILIDLFLNEILKISGTIFNSWMRHWIIIIGCSFNPRIKRILHRSKIDCERVTCDCDCCKSSSKISPSIYDEHHQQGTSTECSFSFWDNVDCVIDLDGDANEKFNEWMEENAKEITIKLN